MRDKHILAGEKVVVHPIGEDHQALVDGAEFRIEDYWQNVSGSSWRDNPGNFAALNYMMRAMKAGLPLDDEVVYGKISGFGYLVHISELGEVVSEVT